MSQTSYGEGLIGTAALKNILGTLELMEAYGVPGAPGQLYYDSAGVPTIGYGFNLNISNSLAAVLDGILPGDQKYVAGGNNDNVFVAADQGQSPLTTTQVLGYFSWLINKYGKRSVTPDPQTLQTYLTDALQQFYAGKGSTLYNSGDFVLPTSGDTAYSDVLFEFSESDRTNPEQVLSNLIVGASINEIPSGSNDSNLLTVNGYSPGLYDTLSRLGLTGSGDVEGAPADSPQWAALVAADYNGFPSGTSRGLATEDAAQTWYKLRYGTSAVYRGYLESQLFGLNGNSTADPTSLALQDYEMLTEHRGTIMDLEVANGIDPNSPAANPPPGKGLWTAFTDILAGVRQTNGPLYFPGPLATLPAALTGVYSASDLSLTGTFAPEADQVIDNLNSEYSAVIPHIVDTAEVGAGSEEFGVSPTNIFVAPPEQDIENGFATTQQLAVDAGAFDPGTYGALEAAANHILLGSGPGDILSGGLGDDLIISGTGAETLNAGLGSDTLIGGGGNDVLNGQRGAQDVFDLQFGDSPAGAVETLVDANGSGSIYVNGAQIGNRTLTPSGNLLWTDGTDNYTFVPASKISSADLNEAGISSPNWGPDVGELKITPVSGGSSAWTIDVLGFNLAQATSVGGFLGINVPETATVAAGAWVDPPATFPGGSEQAYTFSVDAPSTGAETITLTLSGASPSDFEAQVGNSVEQLNSNGTFTVTLPAGETSVSFGLIDVTPDDGTSDIASGAILTLTGSVANPANPNGSAIQSSPLSIAYTPGTPDTSTASLPGDFISGTLVGGVTTYEGDGGDDYISAGQGPNDILAQNSGSDSIIGGSGDNTVYGGSGNDVIDLNGSNDLVSLGDGFNTVNGSSSGKDSIYGHGGNSIINGNGGTDLIIGRNGTNQIYADTQTSLANAISDALSGSATGSQGDLLSVGDGDNTIVSGEGNDLITAGTGHDVIVMGPGDDTVEGGIDLINASANWYTTFTQPDGDGGQYVLQIFNAYYDVPGYTNPYPQPYNGTAVENEITIPNAGVANDTIFAGDGNDLFYLGNGNNYVQAGSGNDTIFNGMGNDTVIAGSGADYIADGGGTEYVYGGAGHDTIYGGDGNNTIIGGSGDSTITSASGPTPTYTGATLEQNYVFGGSGNDVIYGSAGSDTLVAGSGNTTIWGQAGHEYLVGGSGKDLLSADIASNATVIAGGTGSDTLYGGADTSGSYYLYGGGGTDLIFGESGQNVIYAGDGGTASAPTSVFGSSTDAASQTTIYGGLGIDTLTGGGGSTVIYAGDGGTASAPDTVAAGSGNTTIYGGLGPDQIQGGSGTDVLYAGDGGTESAPTKVIASSGTATLYGGAGDDFLQDTNGGSDLLMAGTGSDTLLGTGSDTLLAGPGNDALQTYGDGVSVDINSGFGDDSVYEIGATESINFGSGIAPTDFSGGVALDSQGNNYLVLTGDSGSVAIENAFTGDLESLTFADSGSLSTQQLMTDAFGTDQVYEATGSDVVGVEGTATSGAFDLFTIGVQGDDLLTTGPYDDTVSSWGDNTTITGSSESGYGDNIYSAGASASIAGGSGSDTIVGAGADDSIAATTGTMLATVSGANSIITAGLFADTITASGSNDTLVGNADFTTFVIDDASAVVQAPAGTDTVLSSVSYTAPTNVDILTLIGSTDITATGNADSDTLKGGAGSDTLIAGSGNDLMIGGTGSTTFVVNSANDVVQDATGNAANVIQSSVSYSLPTNVNTLTFTGSAALVGTGNSGADTLISNDAADTLIGGTGNDTFVIDNPNVVLEDSSSSATNAAESSVSYTLLTNVNTLILTGTADLVGVANGANDTLVSNTGIDTLIGGAGNDLFVVNNPDDVLVNVSASDTVEMATSYSLPSNIDTLVLTGSADVAITGNSGNDRITANAGADTLIAGSGVDTFIGGTGADTFVLNNSADVVQESSVTGSVVESAASYSLPADVDVLQLTGSASIEATANSGNDSLIGAEGADTLVAGAGADTLVAGTGLATLIGGSGNDTFVVDDPGDVIEDTASGASNTLLSSVSYSMPTDVNSLELTGDAALSATTNGGNDLVTANAGADTLVATTGADTLVAGAAPDTLIGGTGDDLFVLNNSSDVVIASAPYGVDTIESSASLTLPSNVNILLLEGSSDLAATANGGSDSITANAGADTLVAGAGTDTLVAGTGPDTFIGGSGSTIYVIDSASDVIENVSGTGGNKVDSSVSFTLPSGIDSLTLTGSDGLVAQGNDDADNTLIANSGNDTLVSGTANTTFEGGDGNDTFIVNNAEDVVEATTSGTNTIVSSVSYTLPDNVTALILTGTGDLLAAGNTRADSIVGNGGADTLVAGVGNDTLVAGTGPATLIGGVGNDTFVIDSSDDVIEDTVTGEQNTLISSVSVTLPGNFTTLELSGTAALVGTANATSDAILGGSGADTLVAVRYGHADRRCCCEHPGRGLREHDLRGEQHRRCDRGRIGSSLEQPLELRHLYGAR